MKWFSNLAATSLVVVLIACGGGKEATKKDSKVPKWVTKPGLYDDAIVAAGIGDGLTEQKAKSQAEADGRKKIAQTIETQVKSLTTNFIEEAGTTTDKGKESAAQEYFQEITQNLTNVTLNGATLEEYWPPFGQTEGNRYKIYAKMVLKKSTLIDAYKKQVQDDLVQKKIKGVKASADEALKALDKAVSKWEGTAESEE